KNIPLIIDADGLNCLAGRIDIIRNANCRAVLTPHPAELGRLLGISSAEVLADRQAMAKKLAELTGAVVCAKGYPTYIVSPDGRTRALFTGNGGLSRGGSGDVLTGIISGLISSNRCDLPENGNKLFEAASAGVYIFGAAADIAADVLSKTGMLPTDAAKALPDVFARLGK
ncbi:MAG: NAD(P)H-hydrate dehydratase, partial [Oscillospiraceae bacterium]|nr:NAD(P)H-hydrate dehydratase [Oscillospiraceae bacterium]